MKKLNFIILMILICSASLFSFTSKDEAFEHLKSQYSNAKNIGMNFKNADLDIAGSLFSVRNENKFRLELNGRTIISDGKSIWNIDESSTVVISKYDQSAEEMSPDKVFLDIGNSFTPISYKSIQSSQYGKSFVLQLATKDKKSKIFKNLDKIEIWFNPNGEVIGLGAIFDTYTLYWELSNIKTNTNFAANYFTYKAQEGDQVIDMR